MPHIQGVGDMRQWMLRQGVSAAVADRAARALTARLSGGEELEEEELQLIEIYLGRPGANPVADQAIRQALSRPRRASAKGRIPVHTPDWTDHNIGDPGATASAPRGYDMTHRLHRGVHHAAGRNTPRDVRTVQQLINRVAGS